MPADGKSPPDEGGVPRGASPHPLSDPIAVNLCLSMDVKRRIDMKKVSTKMLVMLAVLVALNLVLGRPPLSFMIWSNKIGFGFVPIFIAAWLYGPLAAGIVGALGDFLGAILFPIGPYFPGFTLTAFLTGVVFGLLLHKSRTVPRILTATLINQLVLGLVVNTYWISVLNEAPFGGLLITRIVQCAIMLVLEFMVIFFLRKALDRLGKERFL